MSKIQGNLPQAFQFQADTGKTQGKEKSDDKSSVGSEHETSETSAEGDLPGVGFGRSDLSQGGFDTNEQSKGVIDVMEERQRQLQEDGLGEKLLGGVRENSQSVIHRNLGASQTSSISGPSALRNVEALGQTSRSRTVSRPSAQRDIASTEAGAITPRKKGAALDDDLPRVGFTKE